MVAIITWSGLGIKQPAVSTTKAKLPRALYAYGICTDGSILCCYTALAAPTKWERNADERKRFPPSLSPLYGAMQMAN